MDSCKTVGIKNLKNNLSAFIRDMKRGTRVLITDRDRVVAELSPPRASEVLEVNSLIATWSRESKIRLPLRPKTKLLHSSLKLPAGTAQKLIDEDRAE